jgi:hypothetical protein
VPLGDAWTLDVTSTYGWGRVEFDAADPRRPGGQTATIAGLNDVRVRATGRLSGDALIVTLGANAPTGQSRLDNEQLTAVRVLAAPALGLIMPPVGAGGSGTLGILSAHRLGSTWALAAGASYELHDSYTPIAALVAGAPSTDFRPGDVLHVSAGADGLVGRHRLSLSFAGDFFGVDRLRAGAVPTTGGATEVAQPVARVRLGPVLSSDAQLFLAVPGTRDAVLWVSNRWRAQFARDGISVDGSSGDYLYGGARTTLPVTLHTDLLIAADSWWQSGLAFDDALLTASTVGGGATVGIAHHFGGVTVQPFARVQAGRVRTSQRPNDGAATVAGGSLGLTILSRF